MSKHDVHLLNVTQLEVWGNIKLYTNFLDLVRSVYLMYRRIKVEGQRFKRILCFT